MGKKQPGWKLLTFGLTIGLIVAGLLGYDIVMQRSAFDDLLPKQAVRKTAVAAEKNSLKHDWQSVINNSQTNIDVAVYNHKTGKLTELTENAKTGYPMASTVKVGVLAALLHSHEQAGTAMTDDEDSSATYMITISDNDSTNFLVDDMGGLTSLADWWQTLGLRDTQTTDSWGGTTTTAADQVALLNEIYYNGRYLDATDREYMQNLLGQVSSWQHWGITAGATETDDVAVKNGWLYEDDYGWIVNSMGHIKTTKADYTIAVFTYDNATEEDGIDQIEALAKMTYQALNK